MTEKVLFLEKDPVEAHILISRIWKEELEKKTTEDLKILMKRLYREWKKEEGFLSKKNLELRNDFHLNVKHQLGEEEKKIQKIREVERMKIVAERNFRWQERTLNKLIQLKALA